MKNLLFACALVLSTAIAAAAQTPTGTPPSGTMPPSGSTAAPKPDATIETESNIAADQTNPADRASMEKKMRAAKMEKRKSHKMKVKNQSTSTM